MSTPISTNTLVPLSANYTYDEHIKIKSTIAQWQDGYVTYIHPAFADNRDTSLNNNTLLYLTSTMNLFNFIEEIPLNDIFLGDYIVLSIDNQYVTNVSNSLYLTSVSSDDSFFRFIGNDDKTYSILHSKGLYVTVDAINPYNLTLQSQDITDNSKYQKFNIEATSSQLYIMTQADGVERYWSYTKAGPEQGRIRANGSIANNDYIFNVSNFSASYAPLGLTRDHTWVKYYNALDDKTQNKTVEIEDSISAVNIQHLFDLPYKTKINFNDQQMDVNLANMKNIQNANYEYSITKTPDTCYFIISTNNDYRTDGQYFTILLRLWNNTLNNWDTTYTPVDRLTLTSDTSCWTITPDIIDNTNWINGSKLVTLKIDNTCTNDTTSNITVHDTYSNIFGSITGLNVFGTVPLACNPTFSPQYKLTFSSGKITDAFYTIWDTDVVTLTDAHYPNPNICHWYYAEHVWGGHVKYFDLWKYETGIWVISVNTRWTNLPGGECCGASTHRPYGNTPLGIYPPVDSRACSGNLNCGSTINTLDGFIISEI